MRPTAPSRAPAVLQSPTGPTESYARVASRAEHAAWNRGRSPLPLGPAATSRHRPCRLPAMHAWHACRGRCCRCHGDRGGRTGRAPTAIYSPLLSLRQPNRHRSHCSPHPAASGRFSRLDSYRSLACRPRARRGPFPRFLPSTRPSRLVFRPPFARKTSAGRRRTQPCSVDLPCHARTSHACLLLRVRSFFFLLYFSAKLKIGRDRPTRVPEISFTPTPVPLLGSSPLTYGLRGCASAEQA